MVSWELVDYAEGGRHRHRGVFGRSGKHFILSRTIPCKLMVRRIRISFLVSFSLVTGPIFDWGHFRILLIVGTFLTVFGIMMNSISNNYWQVFLSQGFCVGLGTGCLFLPSVAIMAIYFTTKRALAIRVVAAGGSIGSVIYPIVFHRL